MTNTTKIFLVILFSLAAVGLVIVLQTNPMMVILSIAFTILILYALNRYAGPRNSGTDKGYKRALQRQKRKGKMSPVEMQKLTRLKKSSTHIPFKVIEGNKGKPPKEKRSHYH